MKILNIKHCEVDTAWHWAIKERHQQQQQQQNPQ